ncbi:hypothetical protein ACROYT_G031298 [Oculina patagonica]
MIRHEDTRLTKLFVGGIPYDTDDDSLRCNFEQYGPIKEAVVIRDRETLASKGYGFVTFHDKDCAEKACVNKRPVIDGRTANVNLAYLGAKPKNTKGNGKNASSSYGFAYKNTIMGSQQFATNFTNGFSAQIPAQQIQTVPLVSPVPQSPNGQIPSMQPTIQPIQLIEYNGVPTIVFGAVYDQLYYSTQPSYVPSPTLPPTTIAPSFTYQAVAPQTPPLNGGSLTGQHFFPTHVEIIGQPQH